MPVYTYVPYAVARAAVDPTWLIKQEHSHIINAYTSHHHTYAPYAVARAAVDGACRQPPRSLAARSPYAHCQ